MRNILISFSFITLMPFTMQGQQQVPQLLKGPVAWEFERFALPPVFAPGIPYTGAEELRFAPGMFNKDAADYFTYAFIAELDNIASISQEDIGQYLRAYFKGLCYTTAKDRKLVVDTSNLKVSISRKVPAQGNDIVYDAVLNVFGVFADGAPVKLNAEIKVVKDEAAVKVYLIFIASPKPKAGSEWSGLYKIQKDFILPG